MCVVHFMIGYCFRFISFSSVVAALFLFYFQEKRGLQKPDVAITYTLILGAIGLDTISLFMVMFSDWTVATLKKPKKDSLAAISNCKTSHINGSNATNPPPQSSISDPCTKFLLFPRLFFVCRWSESVSTYNLIDYFMEEGPERIDKINDCFKLSYYVTNKGGKVSDYISLKFLDQIKYVSKVRFDEQLRNFIFDELKLKSEIVDDPETSKEISSARGDWVLRYYAYDSILHWFEGVDYDESLLLWNIGIATELCLAI